MPRPNELFTEGPLALARDERATRERKKKSSSSRVDDDESIGPCDSRVLAINITERATRRCSRGKTLALGGREREREKQAIRLDPKCTDGEVVVAGAQTMAEARARVYSSPEVRQGSIFRMELK